jgi:geranylgeranyl reductase family protein
MSVKFYDVLIVGAGPIGSYLSHRLASYGYRVAVFERKEKIGEAVCCTGIIGKECVENFPISNDIILSEAKSASFFSPSGKILRMAKGEVQAYVIWRPDLDQALANTAAEDGAEYFLGCNVRDVRLENDGVVVEVKRRQEVENLRGRVVVITSGFGSGLPRRLGLGNIADFVTGAQSEVTTGELDEVEIYLGQRLAPGFYAWLVPTWKGKALVGVLTRHNSGSYLRSFISELSSLGKITSTAGEMTCGGIPLCPLPQTYDERVLVVGDAAGQVKPTTGGGIYYGLLCAEIAAKMLSRALPADELSARQLAPYEKEGKKKLSRELQVGYHARKLYEKLNDEQIDRIFDLVESNHIHESILEAEDFSFDWHADLILRMLRNRAIITAAPTLIKNWRPWKT